MGALRSALNSVEDGGYPIDKVAEFNAMQGGKKSQAEFAAGKWKHELAQEQFRLLSAVREQHLALSEISDQFSAELGFALALSFQRYCLPLSNSSQKNGSSDNSRDRRNSESKSPARGSSRNDLNSWNEENDGSQDEEEDTFGITDDGKVHLERGESDVSASGGGGGLYPKRTDSVNSLESRDSVYNNKNRFMMNGRSISKGMKIGKNLKSITNIMKFKKGSSTSTFGSNKRLHFTKLTPLPPGAARIRLDKAQMSVHHALVDFDPLFESVTHTSLTLVVFFC